MSRMGLIVVALAATPASARAETIDEQVAYLLYQVESGGHVQRSSVVETVVAHASASPATYLTHAAPEGQAATDRTRVTYRVERTGACTFKGVMVLAEGDKALTAQTIADLSGPIEVSTTTPDDPGIRLTGRGPCTFDIRRSEKPEGGAKEEHDCRASFRAPVTGPDLGRLRRTLAAVQATCAGKAP